MNDPHTPSGAAALPKADEPGTYRLVIRARVIQEEPQAVQPHARARALAVIGGSALALVALIWAGVSVIRTDSPAARIPDKAASVVGTEPRQPTEKVASPAASSVGADSTKSAPVPAPPNADASPSPVHEVLPAVPRSALQTIRGTVRVTIRVTIDKQGLVVAAAARDRGPSRYFERLALESSRKWMFTPAATDEPRSVLLQFNFRRDGATAHATPL